MNYPYITDIIDTKNETDDIKTIKFQHNKEIIPGQFYMIWIPGTDEIPMSVSIIEDEYKAITFKKIGEATNALYNLGKNDKIGIRGPYGNGFKIQGKKILMIAGGTGIAMMAPAVEYAIKKNIDTTIILGAKTKKELFFEKRIKKTGVKLHICTDDGSQGYKGFTTELAEELISKNKFDNIFTCGPEKMMKKLLQIRKNIKFQASLERYMKCGFGICGQCCIGDGLRVCKDGPIFDGDTLEKIKEFGNYKKDASGKKIKI